MMAKVKRSGGPGGGVGHWWLHRLTAFILLPLTLWVAFAMVKHMADDHGTVVAWISQPWVAIALILYLVTTVVHAQLGLQAIINDYITGALSRLIIILLVNTVLLVVLVALILSILRIILQ